MHARCRSVLPRGNVHRLFKSCTSAPRKLLPYRGCRSSVRNNVRPGYGGLNCPTCVQGFQQMFDGCRWGWCWYCLCCFFFPPFLQPPSTESACFAGRVAQPIRPHQSTKSAGSLVRQNIIERQKRDYYLPHHIYYCLLYTSPSPRD